jgi:anti-anti-sigma factor
MFIDIDFELDGDGVRRGGAEVIGRADRTDDVVVDLARVTRLDSSGIGLLVHLQKRSFERRVQFSIANVKGQPRDLLAQLNLLDMWSAKAAAQRSVAQAKTAPVLQNG